MFLGATVGGNLLIGKSDETDQLVMFLYDVYGFISDYMIYCSVSLHFRRNSKIPGSLLGTTF